MSDHSPEEARWSWGAGRLRDPSLMLNIQADRSGALVSVALGRLHAYVMYDPRIRAGDGDE